MKKLTALLLATMLLASACYAESLTTELGLTSESKPATTYTVEVVYAAEIAQANRRS